MKRLSAILALIALFINAHSQQRATDSLKKLITTAKDDTTKILLLDKLGYMYENSKPDSAMLIAQQEILLSLKANFLKGEATCLNTEGIVFMEIGKALSSFLSAMKLNEKRIDRLKIAANLDNIGTVYSYEGDYRQSINFSKQAKAIEVSIHNDKLLSYNLIGLGDTYEKLNMLDSARIYTQQGYELALKLKNLDLIGVATNNLGNIYSKMHNMHIALDYYRTAIPYFKKSDDNEGICESALGMAKIFKQLGQQNSSFYYAKMSLAAGVHGGFTIRIFNASQFLTAYFKQQGRLDSAFRYQELSIAAKDSMFSQEKNQRSTKPYFCRTPAPAGACRAKTGR